MPLATLRLAMGLAAIFSLALWQSDGCGYEPDPAKGEGEPCTRSDECRIGLQCRGGVCMREGLDAGAEDAGMDAAVSDDAGDAAAPDASAADAALDDASAADGGDAAASDASSGDAGDLDASAADGAVAVDAG